MHELTVWCGFFGAWLVVAGSVYQAVLELSEEEFEMDRLRAIGSAVPRPEPVSAWWWLVPPVRLVLNHRRGDEHRRQLLATISDEDYAAVTHYVNKATGWIYVAGGGSLIAVKETYDLTEEQRWSPIVCGILVVVMLGLGLGNAVARELRTRRLAARRRSWLSPRAAPR